MTIEFWLIGILWVVFIWKVAHTDSVIGDLKLEIEMLTTDKKNLIEELRELRKDTTEIASMKFDIELLTNDKNDLNERLSEVESS
jgi:hypothetical protein